ncbi:hypothetical protein LPJ56_001946 [Coemansia sp. RSA 2599]|nr:hypothetical protein LPJ56_001946 [Coemansia sp. RSA 2599]
MPRCTRNACGQDYEEAANDPISCQYHPGKPEFHEGLKGWTCCKPRVHSFDEFMDIRGCKLGPHSSEPKHKEDPFKADLTKYDDVLPEPQAAAAPSTQRLAAAASAPEPIDEDPEGVEIPAGAKCKRNGCDAAYVSGEESCQDEQCQFHPGKALFHEGNKGWTCCKPRVTEFDEFLRIAGCKTGRHLFVGTQPDTKVQADKCRHDYYQSGSSVIMSIYAKKIDRESSWVKFSPEMLLVHLVYGDGKTYDDGFKLFSEIDPSRSSCEFLSTKAELSLAKKSMASWPALERNDDN